MPGRQVEAPARQPGSSIGPSRNTPGGRPPHEPAPPVSRGIAKNGAVNPALVAARLAQEPVNAPEPRGGVRAEHQSRGGAPLASTGRPSRRGSASGVPEARVDGGPSARGGPRVARRDGVRR
jgi:hypothetical protein